MLIWAAATMPLLITLAVLAAEVLNWQVIAHELQTAVDAAALAGAHEVWVRQEVDSTGQVWSETLYLNEEEARHHALAVLAANLERVSRLVAVTEERVDIDAAEMVVAVTVEGRFRTLFAGRFQLWPGTITRTGAASPVVGD